MRLLRAVIQFGKSALIDSVAVLRGDESVQVELIRHDRAP
jgi:hypothetical protein